MKKHTIQISVYERGWELIYQAQVSNLTDFIFVIFPLSCHLEQ